ncbi:small ribosomal subunit protein mS31-like [Watersipora subatra]|uniref:small ribosomal subunit protein mS31-like n=1 Tax=Watersipora subatra TaxID=2589382 RepID=UPI00355B3EE7
MATSIRILRQVSSVLRECRVQLNTARTIHSSYALNKKKPGSLDKSVSTKGSERDELLGAAAEVAASMKGIEEEAFKDISNQLSALDNLVVERVASRTISTVPKPVQKTFNKGKQLTTVEEEQVSDVISKLKTENSKDAQTVVKDEQVSGAVSKLQTEDSKDAPPVVSEPITRPAVRSQSILSQLEAERGHRRDPGRSRKGDRQRNSMDMSLPRPEVHRLSDNTFKNMKVPDGSLPNDDLLDGVKALNIFNPSKWSEQNQQETVPMIQSWVDDREKALKDAQPFPFNGFEEMIRWTEEGKLWNYPIDNEQGLDEEKNTPFYEHVFLEKHLTAFPESGSVRRFMELVIMGLSKNPHLSVKEKVAHINWFEEYFKQKQSHVVAEPLLADRASAQ